MHVFVDFYVEFYVDVQKALFQFAKPFRKRLNVGIRVIAGDEHNLSNGRNFDNRLAKPNEIVNLVGCTNVRVFNFNGFSSF